MGSLDQRAAKLLAFKFGLLKKKSAVLGIPAVLCAVGFDPSLGYSGSNHFQSLMASNFAAL